MELLLPFKDFIKAFVPIFVAIDPLGLLPAYMSLTENIKKGHKDKVILLSMITALAASLGFLFLGKGILIVLGIRVSDFLVAGGLILIAFSANDLLRSDQNKVKVSADSVGVVPLGMPLIAGPAVLTTTLMVLDAHGVYITSAAIILNLLLTAIALKLSNFFMSVIGGTGLKAISKLTSILLTAYAVMMIRRGIIEIITFYSAVK